MAQQDRRMDPDSKDRNALALLVFLASFAIGYLLSALLMAALLESGGEALPRDSIWKVFVFWAIVIGPQLIGVIVALFATRLFVSRFNRSFLFYVVAGLGIVAVCLYCLFLLVPPTSRSILLVILQACTAWIGFVMLRRGLRRTA